MAEVRCLIRSLMWHRVTKFDKRSVQIADRHYSRRKPGTKQFMPPGQTIILLWDTEDAVFGWHRPHPDSGMKLWNGLEAWSCTIFRNESDCISSHMILQAELMLGIYATDIGPDGMITYVWDSKIRSNNPGYCFKQAGWNLIGRSADNKKTLLQKLA